VCDLKAGISTSINLKFVSVDIQHDLNFCTAATQLGSNVVWYVCARMRCLHSNYAVALYGKAVVLCNFDCSRVLRSDIAVPSKRDLE